MSQVLIIKIFIILFLIAWAIHGYFNFKGVQDQNKYTGTGLDYSQVVYNIIIVGFIDTLILFIPFSILISFLLYLFYY